MLFYHTYTVVFTYFRGKEVWNEYWQLTRPRWTARESKMVWSDLHDAIIADRCNMATARVCYGTIEEGDYYKQIIMRFCTSTFPDIVVDHLANDGDERCAARQWATITYDV